VKKIIVVAMASALVGAGATAVFGAGDKPPERQAVKLDSVPRDFSGTRFSAGTEGLRLPNSVNCRSVQCFNRAISKVNRAVNALNFVTLTCEQVVPVSRFNGYEFNVNGVTFITTALDNPEAGEPVGSWVVVDTCTV
jgi:hypothetical protein